MDQERFDQLARTLVSGSSRRRVLGGAIAGLFGASVATVAGIEAKSKKKRHRKGAKHKKKGRVRAASTCSAADILTCSLIPGGACCNPTDDPALSCVSIAEQDAQAAGKQPGICGSTNDTCFTCPTGTYCAGAPGTRYCACDADSCGEGNCCAFVGGDFGFQCIANGSGTRADDGEFYCGVGGGDVIGTPPPPAPGPGSDTCNQCSVGTGLFSGCCTDDGFCNSGTTGNNCGSGGNACAVCENGGECGLDQTCTGGGGTCPTGFEDCDGACVNLGTNPNNCGACGNVCPSCGKRRQILCNGGACGCSQKRKKRKKRRRRHH